MATTTNFIKLKIKFGNGTVVLTTAPFLCPPLPHATCVLSNGIPQFIVRHVGRWPRGKYRLWGYLFNPVHGLVALSCGPTNSRASSRLITCAPHHFDSNRPPCDQHQHLSIILLFINNKTGVETLMSVWFLMSSFPSLIGEIPTLKAYVNIICNQNFWLCLLVISLTCLLH